MVRFYYKFYHPAGYPYGFWNVFAEGKFTTEDISLSDVGFWWTGGLFVFLPISKAVFSVHHLPGEWRIEYLTDTDESGEFVYAPEYTLHFTVIDNTPPALALEAAEFLPAPLETSPEGYLIYKKQAQVLLSGTVFDNANSVYDENLHSLGVTVTWERVDANGVQTQGRVDRLTLDASDKMQRNLHWLADIPLSPGRNTIKFRSVDGTGNESEEQTLIVINKVPPEIEVIADKVAQAGSPYLVKATASDESHDLKSLAIKWVDILIGIDLLFNIDDLSLLIDTYSNIEVLEPPPILSADPNNTELLEHQFSYTPAADAPDYLGRFQLLGWLLSAEDIEGDTAELPYIVPARNPNAQNNPGECEGRTQLTTRSIGDPIDTASGAQLLEHNPLSTDGALPLNFKLRYNSLLVGQPSKTGHGWETQGYDIRLRKLPQGDVLVSWSANRYNLFSPSTSSGTDPSTGSVTDSGQVIYEAQHWGCRFDTLEEHADGSFTLTRNSKLNYQFDSNGILQSLQTPQGLSLQFSHDSNHRLVQVLDPLSGAALAYSYNTDGLLETVSDNLGRSVSLNYDANQNLVQIIDAANQSWTYEYSDVHQIVAGFDPENRQRFRNTFDAQYRVVTQDDGVSDNALLQLSYDDNSLAGHRITTVTLRDGSQRIYTTQHDTYLLTAVQDELGHTQQFEYDANGKLIKHTDAKGNVTQYLYDEDGDPRTLDNIIDPTGTSTRLFYDENNNLSKVENALGHSSELTYDANNRLVQTKDAAQNSQSYSYNADGLLASSTTPRQGTTQYRYSQGRVSQIEQPNGQIVQLGYDAAGRLQQIIDADNNTTSLDYDGAGRITAIHRPLNNSVHITWDSRNQPLSITDANGNLTRFEYDANGNRVKRINALNQATRYEYDGEDRLVKVIDARGNSVQLTYDAKGRLQSIRDALSNTQSFVYDENNNLTQTLDALNRVVSQTQYDTRDNPTQVTDALNNNTSLNYDALSRVTEVQEPLQHFDELSAPPTTQFQYDALNRLIKSIDALQGESTQGFDADGNRDNFQDPNQHTTQFGFDESGRLLNETTTGGGSKTYTWNTLNQLIQLRNGRSQDRQFNYDALGRLSSISDTDGTLTYTFDANGNLLNVTETSAFPEWYPEPVEGLVEGNISREYDALNRVTRYTNSQGHVLQYAYDEVGNLTQLTYPDGKQVFYTYDANNRLSSVKDWANRETHYSYDTNGRLIETQRPNGTVQTRSYDAKGQLLQLKDVDALGNVIVQYDFTFDAGGDITQEISIPTPNAFAMANADMAYTEYNRLLTVNGLNPTFDLDGNMTQGLLGGSLETFNFDSRNRLTQAGNTRYLYDAENQRIGITESGQTTRFVINSVPALSQVLVRTKPDGTQTYYVYGLGLIGEESAGNYRSYHYDLRGSTVALTDASGIVTQRFQYSAYGLLVDGDINQTPFLFNGAYGVMTDSNGLYYMRARFYNPEIRRFVNQDILLGRVSDGQSLNRFAFVTGNPIMYTDPFGLKAVILVQTEVGEVFGKPYGHAGIAIENRDTGLWEYYSFGGGEGSGNLYEDILVELFNIGRPGYIEHYSYDDNMFHNPELAEDYLYDQFLVFNTTPEEERRMIEYARQHMEEVNNENSNYKFLYGNCADFALNTLIHGYSIGGIPGHVLIGNDLVSEPKHLIADLAKQLAPFMQARKIWMPRQKNDISLDSNPPDSSRLTPQKAYSLSLP